ncbi:MAG: RHS repeat-associated core domain-containing protein [Phycisphaerae bacterium]|nr:RHS repeat-associated core domain-containing protein [Phycisphaerae bacterium]MDD5381418.1 RHS repeat-associated core domain-containing protein [Phycisphaerae bacterium]
MWLLASFRFTGQYYDSDTGQYYLRARQYDPYISRFISSDPAFGKFQEPMSLHKYLYCQNDPVDGVDLDGRKVYWAARDTSFSPFANHHFILAAPDKPGDFTFLDQIFKAMSEDGVGILQNIGGGEKGFAMGAESQNDRLKAVFNKGYDIDSSRQYWGESRSLRSWDFDRREVMSEEDDTSFVYKLVLQAFIYVDKEESAPIDFDLRNGPNCASWVNSMFRSAGISEARRHIIGGSFSGISLGQDYLIDDWYFDY